ncbi:MAG: histidinol-phosphatase HisJ family protein [Clostridia bacterium]|nr:histidinol-phosphatase HisJ family protein [Clostridia bacterium]
MFDCHMHCNHSADCRTSIDDMVAAAIGKGMRYIAFTDHLDRDYLYDDSPDKDIRQLDIQNHINELNRVKEKYNGKIEIACGVECSYSKSAENDYCSILDNYHFDLILNSVHSIKGVDCYHKEFYIGKSKRQAYEEYLLAILDSINAKYPFDIVTHIGYVCRKAPYENKDMNYSEFADIIDCILKGIINKDISLELNSKNDGTNSPFLPYLTIIDRYIELGGREFTFGSDAHGVSRVDDKYDIVKDYLISQNINYINIYKNRQKTKIDIR